MLIGPVTRNRSGTMDWLMAMTLSTLGPPSVSRNQRAFSADSGKWWE